MTRLIASKFLLTRFLMVVRVMATKAQVATILIALVLCKQTKI